MLVELNKDPTCMHACMHARCSLQSMNYMYCGKHFNFYIVQPTLFKMRVSFQDCRVYKCVQERSFRRTGRKKLGGRKKFAQLFPIVPDLSKKNFRANFPKLLSTGVLRTKNISECIIIYYNFYIFPPFSTII